MIRSIHGRLFATTILAAMAPIAPAMAQQTPVDTAENTPAEVEAAQDPTPEPADPQDDIVVTGTRIARPDLVASSPVAVISDEALKETNVVTVEQILSANPQFSPAFGGSSNNPGNGSATVDLRGLGPTRTLVLVDGKRAPTFDTTGIVDVNSIPTALIKRVEVLTGGASAVYGSDAISGVVNFVMNDRFKGIQADASAQITKYGDGALYNAALTGGMGIGDRGNVVVSVGWSKRNEVFFGDRSYTRDTLDSYDLTQSGGSSNTVPTAFDVPGRDRLQVLPNGTLTDFYQYYSYNPVNYAQLPLDRWNAMALLRYELSDDIEAYGRANYSHIEVSTNLAATATAGFGFNLDPSNPFLTPSMIAAFFDTTANPDLIINDGSGVADDPTARAGTSLVGIRRRMVETGGRLTDSTTKNRQFVGGLKGVLGSFNWDVFAQYGKSSKFQLLQNDLSYTALKQALDVVAGPGGQPVCADPSGGCVPLNVFTTAPISQQSLAFVLRNATQSNKISQFVTGANIGGDLGFLKSPWASNPAAASVGVEYRKEKGSTLVDDNYASGDLIYYGQGQNVAGSYNVKEVYGEIKVPLVEDRPGFYSLGLEAGARYSDYSTVGGVWTYKFGGDYAPIQGVRFRSIYQRAVRAPNIYELYSPVVAATGGLNNDPCAAATVPTAIAAECIRQGAPAGKIGTIPGPIAGQINIFYGGNPNLSAEKATTFTAGVVVNPPSLRGFSASLDFYRIKIANAIAATPPQQIIDACFANPGAANPSCQGIVRNPIDGSLSGDTTIGVPAGLGNVAELSTKGIDVGLRYGGGTRGGFRYDIGLNGTRVISYKFGAECSGRFGPVCDLEPQPKWKHIVDANLGFGVVNFNTRWRYLGSTKADAAISGPDGIQNQKIKAYNYFDETVSFDISDKYTFRVGVLNLFDKKPPLLGDTSGASLIGGGTFPNTYDVLGRSYFASVTAKF